jgi:hypothetical protein
MPISLRRFARLTTAFLLALTGPAMAGQARVVTIATPTDLTSTPQITPLGDAAIDMDLDKLIAVKRAPACARFVSSSPVAVVELKSGTPQLHIALHNAGILVRPEGQFSFWNQCVDNHDGWARLGKLAEGWPAGRYEVYATGIRRGIQASGLELAVSDPDHVTPEEAAAAEQRRKADEDARRPKPHFAAVMDRFPELTDDDALDLDKVKAAIEKATPDMWYSVGSCPNVAGYHPANNAEQPGQDPDWIGVEDQIGTDAHPYAEVWTAVGELRLGLRTPKLAPSTPVLVWREDMKDGYVVVVTADGGRYHIAGRPTSAGVYYKCGDAPMLEAGIHAPFPPPLQAVVLSSKQIAALEEHGYLPAGLSKKIEAARAAGSACTDRLWKSRFDARDQANVVANITESTRANRRQRILAEYSAAIPTACASAKKSFDSAFEAAIEANKKRRLKLYQAVSQELEQASTAARKSE